MGMLLNNTSGIKQHEEEGGFESSEKLDEVLVAEKPAEGKRGSVALIVTGQARDCLGTPTSMMRIFVFRIDQFD